MVPSDAIFDYSRHTSIAQMLEVELYMSYIKKIHFFHKIQEYMASYFYYFCIASTELFHVIWLLSNDHELEISTKPLTKLRLATCIFESPSDMDDA